MKKLIALLSVLAIIVCMCACQKKGQTDTDPTTDTQAATQPTETQPETQPTEPVDPLVAQMQELLGQMSTTLNSALTSIYETPADVDLYYLFYNGFADESQDPTDEELVLLENTGKFWPEMDLIRLPIEKMDAALTELFGITLEQTNGVGLNKLVYLEETGCYYTAHTGMEYADITVESVEEVDNTVVVYYEEVMSGKCIVTLVPTEAGGYQILSNVNVPQD